MCQAGKPGLVQVSCPQQNFPLRRAMSDPHPSRPFRGGDKYVTAPVERRTLFQKLVEFVSPGPASRDEWIETLADAEQRE